MSVGVGRLLAVVASSGSSLGLSLFVVCASSGLVVSVWLIAYGLRLTAYKLIITACGLLLTACGLNNIVFQKFRNKKCFKKSANPGYFLALKFGQN